jgi:hypothetical protein
MAATRSKRVWDILIQKYISAHNKDSKYITIERAENDLTDLYNEIYEALGSRANDSIILHNINKLIVTYNREVNNKLLSNNFSVVH